MCLLQSLRHVDPSAKLAVHAGTAKHLIRNGANGAKVAVTLWNTGEEAFRPQVYGDRVTIERRITGSGASKYRVLNPQGRVVSEKRDDMQVAADAMVCRLMGRPHCSVRKLLIHRAGFCLFNGPAASEGTRRRSASMLVGVSSHCRFMLMQAVLDYFNLDVSKPVTGDPISPSLCVRSHHGQHGRDAPASR